MSEQQAKQEGAAPDAAGQTHVIATLENLAGSNGRVIALQCLLAVVAYAVMLNGPLFFDDQQFIEANEHVINFDVEEIYTSSVTEGVGIQSNTYRPHQQIIFAVLYKFFALAPVPYHLVSLVVHVLNAFLVFLLLVKLSLGRPGSLIASLLFLVHPVQTQAVSYVAGLAGPLSFLFIVSGLHAWLASATAETARRRYGMLALALGFFVDAALTKSDVVIVFPLVLVLAVYLVLTGRVTFGRSIALSVASVAIFAVGFFALKLTVLNFTGSGSMVEGSNLYTESLTIRLFTFVSVLDRYVELILWPAALSYSKPKIIYSTLLTLHGAVGLVLLAIGAMAVVRAKQWPIVFLGCGWFFAALAPYSGVVPLTSMYLEHWLYIPLVGPLILIAAFYQKAKPAMRNNFVTIAIPVLLILTARTAVRNADWADPEKFYTADMQVAGPSIQMLNNLAIHLTSIGETDKAIKALTIIIQANDTTPEPHVNLARIYVDSGDYGSAREEFDRALEIAPADRNALMGLRGMYDAQGLTVEAMKLDQQIRAIDRDLGL